jgi:hypothetical protein
MSDQEGEGADVSVSTQRPRQINSASTLVDMEDQEAAAALDKRALSERRASIAEAAQITGVLTSPWRSLGGQKSVQSYEMQHLALTNSNKYLRLRSARTREIQVEVESVFRNKVSKYLDLGWAREDAEDKAMKLAKAIMDSEMSTMQEEFGEKTDAVVTGASAWDSGNMFTGNRAPSLKK